MFASARQPFSVNTNLPDSQIYINGEFVGNGQVQTSVPKDKSVSVMAKKDGYYPVTRDIGTKMSSLGVLDIVGGCIFLLPFIGLAFPASHEVDISSVSLILQPAAK